MVAARRHVCGLQIVLTVMLKPKEVEEEEEEEGSGKHTIRGGRAILAIWDPKIAPRSRFKL